MNEKKSPDSSAICGMRIRSERLRRKKTQEEFSRLLGISPSYLGALERGQRPISKNMMKRLHERLDLSYDYLMEGREPVRLPVQNTLHEPGGYRVRRDLSLTLGSCSPQEAQECLDLLQTYLAHMRRQRPSASEESADTP